MRGLFTGKIDRKQSVWCTGLYQLDNGLYRRQTHFESPTNGLARGKYILMHSILGSNIPKYNLGAREGRILARKMAIFTRIQLRRGEIDDVQRSERSRKWRQGTRPSRHSHLALRLCVGGLWHHN